MQIFYSHLQPASEVTFYYLKTVVFKETANEFPQGILRN